MGEKESAISKIRDFCAGLDRATFNNGTGFILGFMNKVKQGDVLLILYEHEGALLTIVTRPLIKWEFGGLSSGIIRYFKHTKTFQRKVGRNADIDMSKIVAIATVINLRREMCFIDPEATVFSQKAYDHAIIPEKLHDFRGTIREVVETLESASQVAPKVGRTVKELRRKWL